MGKQKNGIFTSEFTEWVITWVVACLSLGIGYVKEFIYDSFIKGHNIISHETETANISEIAKNGELYLVSIVMVVDVGIRMSKTESHWLRDFFYIIMILFILYCFSGMFIAPRERADNTYLSVLNYILFTSVCSFFFAFSVGVLGFFFIHISNNDGQ